MGVYRKKHKLTGLDADMYLKLKTSSLFSMLQEAAGEHCLALGYGPEYTMNRGVLWVITRQKAEILRLPRYEEIVYIETWPGPTKHVIYPRYYRVLDADENVLIRASSVWTLIDAKNRTLATESMHGIVLEGTVTGDELSLPRAPKPIEASKTCHFHVPYSYLDINGHMNNTRYLDLAEDLIQPPERGDALSSVCVEYSNEARLHDQIQIRIGQEENRYYLSGETDKHIFKISLEYTGACQH